MKTLVVITTYNRKNSVTNLVSKLLTNKNCDIVLFDDCSEEQIEVTNKRVTFIVNSEHRGKSGYWMTWNDIFAYCKDHDTYDYYIFLPDDMEPCPNFVKECIDAYNVADCICISPLLESRSIISGMSRWGNRRIIPHESYYETHYFDCCGVVRRDFFETLDWHLDAIQPSANPLRSSGVGRQITLRMQLAGKRMGHVKRTLLATTEIISQMNPEERIKHPMWSDWRDNVGCVDVHMASLWRDGHVLKTAETLMRQPELATLYVTLNSYTGQQYDHVNEELRNLCLKYGKSIVTRRCNNEKGSNEKLGMLCRGKSKYFAFADDDILYPSDYLLRLINGCNIHESAVSFHGGIFREWPIKKYYNGGRYMKSWNVPLEQDVKVDILGTGLSLMKKEWFTESELKRLYSTAPTVSMDDIIVSCFLAHKGIGRWVLEHPGQFVSIKKAAPDDAYVYDKYKDKDHAQVEYVNNNYPKSALVRKNLQK